MICPTCRKQFEPETPGQKFCLVDSIRYTPKKFLDRYYPRWEQSRALAVQKIFKVDIGRRK